MALSLQVVFLLSLTSGLFTAGAMSQEAAPEDVPAYPQACPSGWTQFGDRCFIFFMQTKSWADAEAACQNIGGHLASIHSLDENLFLYNFIQQVTGGRQITWIGGSDAEKEGKWFWSDGQTFNFQYWASGQPDNYGGSEHCAEMNLLATFWNDRPCESKLAYACAKDVQRASH